MRNGAEEARRAGATQLFLGRLLCLVGFLNLAYAAYGLVMGLPQSTVFLSALLAILYVQGEMYRRQALAHNSESIAQEYGLRDPGTPRTEPGSVQHSWRQRLLVRYGMQMGVALVSLGAIMITPTLLATGEELRTDKRTADWADLTSISVSIITVVAALFGEAKIHAMVNSPGEKGRPGFFRPVATTARWGMLALLPLAYVSTRAASTHGEPAGWDIFPVYGTLALLAILCLARSNRVFRLHVRAKSSRVVNSPEEVQPHAFSLLLRPFDEDSHFMRDQQMFTLRSLVKGWFSIGNPEEQKICTALDWAGPMIAVGVPGEQLAPDGAARFYLPRHDWHATVTEMMLRARLVVLVLGDSEGVAWELAEAFRVVPPERLVLVVPVRAAGYATLRRNLREALRPHREAADPGPDTASDTGPDTGPDLPDYGGGSGLSSRTQGIIYFTSGWRPVYVPLRAGFAPTDRLVLSLSRASVPVAAQLRTYESGSARPA